MTGVFIGALAAVGAGDKAAVLGGAVILPCAVDRRAVAHAAVHERVLRDFLEAAPTLGYTVMGLDFSPVRGPEGNIEYLAYLKKGSYEAPIPDAAEIVAASHRELAK